MEALGERAERIAALEADIAEMRTVFRDALEDAVGQLVAAKAAAAAPETAATAAESSAAWPVAAAEPAAAVHRK